MTPAAAFAGKEIAGEARRLAITVSNRVTSERLIRGVATVTHDQAHARLACQDGLALTGLRRRAALRGVVGKFRPSHGKIPAT